MNWRFVAGALVSLLAAAGLALGSAQSPPRQTAMAESAPPAARTTVRVGMWTLWRDRELGEPRRQAQAAGSICGLARIAPRSHSREAREWTPRKTACG